MKKHRGRLANQTHGTCNRKCVRDEDPPEAVSMVIGFLLASRGALEGVLAC